MGEGLTAPSECMLPSCQGRTPKRRSWLNTAKRSNSSMRAIRTIIASLPGVLLSAVLLMGWPRVEAHAQSPQTPRKANGTAEKIKRKFDAALSAYRSQQYAKAESEIVSLLAAAPDSFEVNELAGLVYVGEGEYGKAHSYLAKAVRVKGDVVEARTALAA